MHKDKAQDSFVPLLHPELSYTFYVIGAEETPLLIIDNFIKDAHLLVDFCKTNTQFSKVDNFYPGLRMEAPGKYLQSIHYYLAELLEGVFGLKRDKMAGGKSLYSMVVTPPDQLDPIQCIPHIDSYISGDLACVHYLCDKEKGGTSLYRHKKTGYERITSANIDSYKECLVNEGALAFEKKSYMNGSNNYFEQIATVDAVFNRLVVYPSNILHSGNISSDFNFDPNPATGRLTLNSFIFSKRETAQQHQAN